MTRWTRMRLLLLGGAVLVLAAQGTEARTRDAQAAAGNVSRAAAAEHPMASDLEALAQQVAREMEAGRTDEAATLYEDALRKDPARLDVRWALATLLYDTQRYDKALEQFAAVAQARPENGTALALQGLCEATLGERERAALDLRRAIELGIGVPRVALTARYQGAVLTNELGDPDGAYRILRGLAEENADTPAIIEAFGLILLRLPWAPEDIPQDKRDMILLAGRAGYDMARARRSSVGYLAIEELVSRYPAQPNVHYAYGMFLLPDDPAAAIQEFRRELRYSPNHYVAMIQLALAELKRGRAEEALPFAEKAVSLAPNVPASHVALGRALLALDQIDRAVAETEAAVKLAPEIPRLRYGLIQAYRRAGRLEDAAREQEEFRRLQSASGAGPGEDDEGVPSP